MITSSIMVNTISIKLVIQDLPSAVYLSCVVYKLYIRPQFISYFHTHRIVVAGFSHHTHQKKKRINKYGSDIIFKRWYACMHVYMGVEGRLENINNN